MTGKDEVDGGVTANLPPERALCRRCNYPLRGLAGRRCPECGEAFDPANLATMNVGRAVGRVEKIFSAPPRIWLNGAGVLLGLFLCVSASGPGGYFGFTMLAVLGWVVLSAIWVIRLVIAAGIWIARRKMMRIEKHGMRRWMSLPIVFVTSVGVCSFGLPEWVAVRLSRGAMDRLAVEWARSPASLPKREWIGVFPVRAIEALPGGVRFQVQDAGFLDRQGFAYFESGQQPASGPGIYTAIGGGWFRWTDPF